MQNRELLIAEQLIRDKIKVLFETYMQNEDQRLIEESLLREFISNKVKKAILSEKNKLPPHSSTAINYLRRSFKEFIGQLEDDYKELQTNSIQETHLEIILSTLLRICLTTRCRTSYSKG